MAFESFCTQIHWPDKVIERFKQDRTPSGFLETLRGKNNRTRRSRCKWTEKPDSYTFVEIGVGSSANFLLHWRDNSGWNWTEPEFRPLLGEECRFVSPTGPSAAHGGGLCRRSTGTCWRLQRGCGGLHTIVLCRVKDVDTVMGEAKRVLKPVPVCQPGRWNGQNAWFIASLYHTCTAHNGHQSYNNLGHVFSYKTLSPHLAKCLRGPALSLFTQNRSEVCKTFSMRARRPRGLVFRLFYDKDYSCS